MKNPARIRQKEIVKTAVRLFKKEGFSGVSVEDIARACQISIATFYSYFSAKEEVLCLYRNEALGRCHGFYKKLAGPGAHGGLNGAQKLFEYLRFVMKRLDWVGAEFGRVCSQHRLKERRNPPEDKPYLPQVTRLIELGQADGSIRRDYTPGQLTDATDQMLSGAYLRWQLHRSDQPMDAVCGPALRLHCQMLGHTGADGPGEDERLFALWETALYMLIPDPRSGIKQMEESWLERFR